MTASSLSSSSSSTLPSISNLSHLTTQNEDPSSSQLSLNNNNNLLTSILTKTIPKLNSNCHKGSSGRIVILGGSMKYTGAPYYTAMSALRVGCDLVTILCANEAMVPLKSYSPELMVEGVYSAKEFDDLLSSTSLVGTEEEQQEVRDRGKQFDENNIIIEEKVNRMVQKVNENLDKKHVLIIGPGLGRCPIVLKATSLIIQNAMKKHINIVLDADALYLLSLSENHNMFMDYYYDNNDDIDNSNDRVAVTTTKSRIVLTPNMMEYKRLVDSMGMGSEDQLKKKLQGVTVIRKGHEDIIEYIPKTHQQKQDDCEDNNNNTIEIRSRMICNERGGLKRSGGLGM